MSLFQKVVVFPTLLTLAGGAGVVYNMKNEEQKVKLGKYVDESKNATTYLTCINEANKGSSFSPTTDKEKLQKCRKETPTASNGLNSWFGSPK